MTAPSRARATWDTREEKLALVERICERIRNGAHVNHACALELLHKRRLYEWLAEDEEIAVMVAAARAEAGEAMRATVQLVAEGHGEERANANVLLHLLERSHPDEYSPPKTRIEQEVSGKDGAPQEHHVSMDVAGLVRIARAKKEST